MADFRPSARALRWFWLLPAALLVLAFHGSPFRPALDRAFFDLASRHPLRPPPLPANSALVLIDENTLSALSAQGLRWPFPRGVFAQLIAGLRQAGAGRIVMDFTFLEESDAAEQDLLLASVAAATPGVVLARTSERGPVFWPDSFTAAHAVYFRVPRTGLTDFLADSDGIARRYRVPDSLAAVALEPAPTVAGGLLRWHGGQAQIAARGVPVLSAQTFIAAGAPIIRRVAAAAADPEPEAVAAALAVEDPLTGPAFAAVRGRTVFVGANASGTFDLKALPVGKLEPGVLLHWTAWTNLVSGGFITQLPGWSGWLVAILAAAVLVLTAARRTGLVFPTAAAVGFAVLLLGGSYAALSGGWFFPPATPFIAVMLALLGVVAENFWREQQRKREIQAMFGSYVDPGVVELLMKDPAAIRLGGEKRSATVYFSDLAGFTDLSEKLPPEELMQVVNRYLQEMSECLIDHGAYIDKYIGDAVMAVFGAPATNPHHAEAACTGALAARDVLARINADLRRTHGYTLAMRIGINTGEMLVGNLGSDRKKNYTVLGDAVNLASRLEGANKEFGTEIMLGENTARAVAGKFALRPLTRLRVKGKLTAVEVFELVGRPEQLTPDQQSFLAAYGQGYAYFVARRFAEAAADFDRALAVMPDDDLARELRDQSRQLASEPPPADWEPIVTLKSK
ncbi:MAG: CHASE2 domain-containing protein [Verrucomicrobia bacterium]|nr:CHASE2 domain-containing protein [Verrucomicrobiota bacterium]